MKIGKQSFLKITPFLMVLFSMCFVETPALSASRGGRSADMVIENKSSQFAESLSSSTSSSSASKNDLAEQIRKQREAIEARENAAAFATSQQTALKSGQNACDMGLRKCMQDKCGSDFSKCALDGDTMFGDKLNLCRRDLNCSGEEFRLFTTEIKADRDMNAKLSSYTKTIECGNQYNDCIQKECGATFNKCLGKPAEDRAIKNCETLAKNCMEQDSGLSSRVGTVIGRLRENAEKEVKADEERMYKLRDDMSAQCKRLGAMFDERSFDCVYTVNFFAGENQSTPTASRKAYAGNTFVCMQEWFGINVTTYKENAFRETRAQTAASSAMLGSGLGTAAGLITSGAMGRSLETQKAKKEAKNECESQGGKFRGGKCVGAGEKTGDDKNSDGNDGDGNDGDSEEKDCRGGNYKAGSCWCKGVIMTKNSTCEDGKIKYGNKDDGDDNDSDSEEKDCRGGNYKAGSCWCKGVIMTKNSTCEDGKIKYGNKDDGGDSEEKDCRGGNYRAGSCWCKGVIMTKNSTCEDGKIKYGNKDDGGDSEEKDCRGGNYRAGSCWCKGVIMTKNSTCEDGKIHYGN